MISFNSEFNRLIEIEFCIELLKEYNTKSLNGSFDIIKCKKDLNNMTFEDIREKVNQVKELLHKQKINMFLDGVIKETEEYGIKFVKQKYLSSKQEG